MIAVWVIAVSFASGLNVYVTALALGLMARFGWCVLPTALEPLTSWWVIGAAAILFSAEFVADKIPGFDLVWNAAHTLIRIPMAALLAYGAASHMSLTDQALVTALGAAIAMVAHGSKMAARVVVTPSPEPVSNAVLSTTEDMAAAGITWAATHHPIAAASGVGVCVAGGVVLMWFAAKSARRWWGRLAERSRRAL
jgi:hypothetical protein